MTWNQELTQLEYQTSHSCVDTCLWKPIRKMLIHLAFLFPVTFLSHFLLIHPPYYSSRPWEWVFWGNIGLCWDDTQSAQKSPVCEKQNSPPLRRSFQRSTIQCPLTHHVHHSQFASLCSWETLSCSNHLYVLCSCLPEAFALKIAQAVGLCIQLSL